MAFMLSLTLPAPASWIQTLCKVIPIKEVKSQGLSPGTTYEIINMQTGGPKITEPIKNPMAAQWLLSELASSSSQRCKLKNAQFPIPGACDTDLFRGTSGTEGALSEAG
ncbi:hypothetical protein CIHG_09376 [Coccidioides immitis H538.4]|uniref:Uncharacterized protein n=2 Tax=Coccidioides immitis TaxID=5501 RepID=A0A0J8S416_COCIT|nr:hypothetical protein CIRG_02537 [Coccidioides immitis RMSCC 2394]KMU91566.1 hypothetical protein CIHG_09376 [Coccidioides immitis H538.4]